MPYLALPILMMSASAVAFGSMAMVGAALVQGVVTKSMKEAAPCRQL